MMEREIIIVYENIVREYDNALLLRAEFEKRGYHVLIVHKSEEILWKFRNATVLAPNGYTTYNVDFFRYMLNINGCYMFSLQYEQVLSKRMEKTQVHIPKGKAKDMWLFCWGINCYDRLLANGITKEKLRICGAIQLDFLTKAFYDFYLTRTAIATRFHLDTHRKWFLYISSFSYVDNALITKYTAQELADDSFVKEFTEVSINSQVATLNWFEKLLQSDPNLLIIYRKHPVEARNQRIQQLSDLYPDQFRDIDELSVKQWILVADVIGTWFSTSAAEVYVANRPLLLIRPFPIKQEYDVPFYYNAKCLDTYEKLFDAIYHPENYSLPVAVDVLNEYYSMGPVPAYVRVADAVEEITANNQENIKAEKWYFFKRAAFLLKGGIIWKYLMKRTYQFLFLRCGVKITNPSLRRSYCVDEWEATARLRHNPINKTKLELIRKAISR